MKLQKKNAGVYIIEYSPPRWGGGMKSKVLEVGKEFKGEGKKKEKKKKKEGEKEGEKEGGKRKKEEVRKRKGKERKKRACGTLTTIP